MFIFGGECRPERISLNGLCNRNFLFRDPCDRGNVTERTARDRSVDSLQGV